MAIGSSARDLLHLAQLFVVPCFYSVMSRFEGKKEYGDFPETEHE